MNPVDIEKLRQLLGDKESVSLRWIEMKTGYSKSKIKLIASELGMEIYYGSLRKMKK